MEHIPISRAIVGLPDSNGMTELKGEKGRASCKVNGRENRGGCAEELNPFCAPLGLSGC